MTALAVVARNYTWDEVEDSIIEGCIDLLLMFDDTLKAEDMCPGIIQLQGPPVSCLHKRHSFRLSWGHAEGRSDTIATYNVTDHDDDDVDDDDDDDDDDYYV